MSNDAAFKRQPLTRARVAEAALALVDRDGLDALSMRKLAASLGVEAMSLYNHVRNKDDLENELCELLHRLILDEYHNAGGATWRERAHAIAFAYFHVGMAHPNAFSLVTDRPAAGMADVVLLADAVRIFLDAGLSVEQASVAFHAAAAWLVGAIDQELGLICRLQAGEGFKDTDIPEHLAFLPLFRDQCIAHSPETRFAEGLDIMLAGIEAYVARVTG